MPDVAAGGRAAGKAVGLPPSPREGNGLRGGRAGFILGINTIGTQKKNSLPWVAVTSGDIPWISALLSFST